jgi:hypothetical protein
MHFAISPETGQNAGLWRGVRERGSLTILQRVTTRPDFDSSDKLLPEGSRVLSSVGRIFCGSERRATRTWSRLGRSLRPARIPRGSWEQLQRMLA